MRYALWDTKENKVVGMVSEIGVAGCVIHPMPDDTLQQRLNLWERVAQVMPDGKEWWTGLVLCYHDKGLYCQYVSIPVRDIPTPEPELTKDDVLGQLYAELERSKTFGGSNDRRAELQQMIRKVQEKHND